MAWTCNIQVDTKNTHGISGWKMSVNGTILRHKLDGIKVHSTEMAHNMIQRWYVVKSDSVNSRNIFISQVTVSCCRHVLFHVLAFSSVYLAMFSCEYWYYCYFGRRWCEQLVRMK
jgi:hypothetical protein